MRTSCLRRLGWPESPRQRCPYAVLKIESTKRESSPRDPKAAIGNQRQRPRELPASILAIQDALYSLPEQGVAFRLFQLFGYDKQRGRRETIEDVPEKRGNSLRAAWA